MPVAFQPAKPGTVIVDEMPGSSSTALPSFHTATSLSPLGIVGLGVSVWVGRIGVNVGDGVDGAIVVAVIAGDGLVPQPSNASASVVARRNNFATVRIVPPGITLLPVGHSAFSKCNYGYYIPATCNHLWLLSRYTSRRTSDDWDGLQLG